MPNKELYHNSVSKLEDLKKQYSQESNAYILGRLENDITITTLIMNISKSRRGAEAMNIFFEKGGVLELTDLEDKQGPGKNNKLSNERIFKKAAYINHSNEEAPSIFLDPTGLSNKERTLEIIRCLKEFTPGDPATLAADIEDEIQFFDSTISYLHDRETYDEQHALMLDKSKNKRPEWSPLSGKVFIPCPN